MLKIFRFCLKDFLLGSGFTRPIQDDGMVMASVGHADRKIHVSTAPMFRNCVFYEFSLPGLDDKQSIFNYSQSYLDYKFHSIGWLEYSNAEQLIEIFGVIRRIHISWLNGVFVRDNIEDFVGFVNETRRKGVTEYSSLSEPERRKRGDVRREENNKRIAAVWNCPRDKWVDSMIERYSERLV